MPGSTASNAGDFNRGRYNFETFANIQPLEHLCKCQMRKTVGFVPQNCLIWRTMSIGAALEHNVLLLSCLKGFKKLFVAFGNNNRIKRGKSCKKRHAL